jgi:hypothetical protein
VSNLNRQDVQRIADLARLELSAEELDLFTRQLGDILTYVEQIRALDTTGVRADLAGAQSSRRSRRCPGPTLVASGAPVERAGCRRSRQASSKCRA